MYDAVITLIKGPVISYDEYGNEVKRYENREVFAAPRSVYQSEFYNAAQVGLHPSITFRLSHRDDYEGEKLVGFEGKQYDVVRADWTAQRDSLDLICEEKVGVSNV